MGYRRKSRELAMQALFFMDIQGTSSEDMVDRFIENFRPSKKTLPFFMTLLNGVIGRKDTIDAILAKISSNWRVGRMACVDRNIIRIAIYELCFLGDVPSKVAINEAIDIGKRYGTEESGAFINGVLDSVFKLLESGAIQVKREPAPEPV
jgi:transcription antitermination protein NusB